MNFLSDFKDAYLVKRPNLHQWYDSMIEIPAVKETHAVVIKLMERSRQKN